MKPCARNHRRTSGHIFLSSALLLPFVFALVGVCLDLARVRLAQRELGHFADLAAVEAMRARHDTTLDEGARRERAGEYLRRVVARTQRTRDEIVVVPDEHESGISSSIQVAGSAWVPELQVNLDNRWNGDFVSGTYSAWSAHTVSADVCTEAPGSHYCRTDFERDDVDGRGESVVVTLRRATALWPEDRLREVSSSGPALTTAFFRAGFDPEGGFNPRRDGLSARAQAIGGLATAQRVGAATGAMPGACPVGLRETCWSALAAGPPLSLRLNADGVVYDAETRECGVHLGASHALAVGHALMPVAPTATPLASVGRCWLPLVREDLGVGPGPARVMGFVPAALDFPGPHELRIWRLEPVVAAANASAHWAGATATDGPINLAMIRTAQRARTDLVKVGVLER